MDNQLSILIGTDYSDSAINAQRYAIRLAENAKSRLIFMHVYQIPFGSPSEPLEFVKSAEELYQSELSRLTQHCGEIFSELNINPDHFQCEYQVREGGNVSKRIASEAEELHADLIVVGTHGSSGFRKLFFGSHAWGVIKKSNIPVFAIPLEAVFTGIKNIVFGTEYRAGEMAVLNFLVHFAGMFNAELTVLHITNYLLTKKFEKEMFEKLRKEVEGTIMYPKLKVRLMVNKNVSEGVKRFCVEHNTDLLVMSPEKPFLFENFFITNMSMTRKAIFQTRIPLLAIPDFYNPSLVEPAHVFGTSAGIGRKK